MTPSPTYNYPWELIVNSFSGNLSNDEEGQLQQWILSDPLNGKRYRQLQEIWVNGLDDYKFYLKADENKAWDVLQAKLNHHEEEERIVNAYESNKRRFIYRIASIAAIVLIIFGIGVLFRITRSTSHVYETAYNEHKKINLTDGSYIQLQPQTKIWIPNDYNENNRIVKLISGEAFFCIMHQDQKPFIVDMKVSNVEDIGTSFTIRKLNEQIKVAVKSGKVAFIKNATKEVHELKAGMSLTFNIKNETFSNTIYDDSTMQKLLKFDNSPLSDVVVLLQKIHGTKIKIIDKDIVDKKLTANLSGVPYITAIQVICKSLNLEYSVKDSVCNLKGKRKIK